MTHQAPWPPPPAVPQPPPWPPPQPGAQPPPGWASARLGQPVGTPWGVQPEAQPLPWWPPPEPGQQWGSGWSPPPRQQPGRPIRGLLILVGVLGVLLALGVNSLLFPGLASRVLPVSSPSPGATPSRTPSVTASPSGSPTPSPLPTIGADAPALDGVPTTGFTKFGLKDNRLYNLMWRRGEGSAVCEDLTVKAPSVSSATLKAYGTSVIACLLALHRPQAKAQGFTIETPKFVPFAGNESTACGVITDYQIGVYCSRNKTIYISTVADDWKNTYRGARFGYLWVISHEFAHHVQASTGLLLAASSRDLKESRRIELMANCASGVFFGAVWTRLGGGPEEYTQLRGALQRTYADQAPGEGTHGSPTNAVFWFDRGFKHEYSAYARCNTFVASAKEVR